MHGDVCSYVCSMYAGIRVGDVNNALIAPTYQI